MYNLLSTLYGCTGTQMSVSLNLHVFHSENKVKYYSCSDPILGVKKMVSVRTVQKHRFKILLNSSPNISLYKLGKCVYFNFSILSDINTNVCRLVQKVLVQVYRYWSSITILHSIDHNYKQSLDRKTCYIVYLIHKSLTESMLAEEQRKSVASDTLAPL